MYPALRLTIWISAAKLYYYATHLDTTCYRFRIVRVDPLVTSEDPHFSVEKICARVLPLLASEVPLAKISISTTL